MKSLAWHPEDARWLRGWLRSHLVCALAIAAFLLLVRVQPHRSQEVEARANHQEQLDHSIDDIASGESMGARLPPERELLPVSSRRPNPVAPTGWRRTDRGWENVAAWRPVARPLGEIVIRQEAREPNWMKSAMLKLRQVPPLAFAMLQIAAISAIVGVSRRERRSETEQEATFAERFVRHRRPASR